MFIVKVTCYSSAGCSVNKYSFASPSDALNFALNKQAEMSEKYVAGLIDFCAVAFICPEIGERGWED